MIQHWVKRRKIILVALFFAAVALCISWLSLMRAEKYYVNRGERIAFLVDELTTTPERQQRAFDEIVKDENGAFVYLLKHLDDRRPLARHDALFLNTHPKTLERYFHAGGKRVDETILRYLCWKTESCDVGFDVNDAESVKVQREKIERYCRENFNEPEQYEDEERLMQR